MKKIFLLSLLFVVVLNTSVMAYSKGEVKEIQTVLKDGGYYSGQVNGKYDRGTKEAVSKFQKQNGLKVDGIAGKRTKQKLFADSTDVDLIAAAINGEARGESYLGQVAVGAVILNRVKSPSFPNTVKGVIYQKNAFTAVSDGQIKKKVTASCKKAAKEAIAGADPTGGSLYYYNPSTATNKWIRTRKIVKRIGNHVFCR